MDDKPRRRWFAEFAAWMLVFGLPLGVAVAVGTVIGSAEGWSRQRTAAMNELQGQVQFEPEQTGCTRRMGTDPKYNDLVVERSQRKLGWRLRIFLDKGVEEIKYGPPRNPELEQRLHSLFPEAIIWLRHPRPDLYAPPPAPLAGTLPPAT